MTALLEIRDLKAEIAGKQILNGYDLTVKAGEVHAIMGPNGSGKSTLSYVLSGRPGYKITEGQALLAGADLSQMSVDERA
ncbi:MAG: ATP-binding cassette domain-containing protein, partial [Methylocystis sp.]|nr:ATP-binding cassette domain-containing protein [Methylocystis sp.]